MSKTEEFLSADDESQIVEAIRVAEENTSGEIRVHIEASTNIPIDKRSLEVFHYLKMDNTKQQNGVLIYVAVNDKAFYIYGDKGINEAVESDFWDCTKDAIQTQFKQGNFKQGLIDGISRAGTQLEQHFPWLHTDTNELPNDISKG